MNISTQLYNVSPEDFINRIEIRLEKRFKRLEKSFIPKPPNEYLTRKEVSKLLSISLPTLHDWTRKGILNAYRIGNRVLFKRHEIEESLTQIARNEKREVKL